MEEYIVSPEEAGTRLDAYIASHSDLSRSAAVRLIEGTGFYMSVGGAVGNDTDEELTVMRQYPAAGNGATARYGTVITVEFYKKTNTGE